MKRPIEPLIFPSLRAASGASGIPYAVLKSWKADGLPGFEHNGRVDLRAVLAAAFAQGGDVAPPDGVRSWREALNRVQAERAQLRLDRERGEVVPLRWVVGRFQEAGASIDSIRAKSESEDALKFADAAGDVAACREVVLGIWDRIMTELQVIAVHFEKGPPIDETTTN